MNINKIGNILYNGPRSRLYPRTSRLLDLGRQPTRVALVTTPSRPLSCKENRQNRLPSHRPKTTQLRNTVLVTRAKMSGRVPIEPQRVDAPLTQSATFLVLSVTDSPEAIKTIRSTLASVDDLSKNVAIRDLGASFACTVGIGSEVWDRVTGLPRPAELHPFPAVKGKVHTAVSTPGDLLFHIRSERRDLCFEFERQLMDLLGDAVAVVDETVGFRYFDVRDLLGFVDGTANPVGPAVNASILVAEEDASAVGGSYSE
jgi:putative iron-dependent peroxidase